jgi:hypothetical protein
MVLTGQGLPSNAMVADSSHLQPLTFALAAMVAWKVPYG